MNGRSVGQLDSRSVDRTVGRSDGRSVGRLVHRTVGRLDKKILKADIILYKILIKCFKIYCFLKNYILFIFFAPIVIFVWIFNLDKVYIRIIFFRLILFYTLIFVNLSYMMFCLA